MYINIKINQSVQLSCGEAVSKGKAEIFREVAEAMVRAGRQQTARWQRINKEVIKTRPSLHQNCLVKSVN